MTTEPSRLDRIEAILEQTTQRLDRVAEQQVINTETIGNLSNNLNDLSNQVNDFTSTANTVLGRSAILDDIIVRLDRNFELHLRDTNPLCPLQAGALNLHDRL